MATFNNDAMLAAAAQMLGASGPSRQPMGLGAILGGGMATYLGAAEQARQRKMEEDQAKQIAEMRALQTQELQGTLEDRGIKRAQAQKMIALQNEFTQRGATRPAPAAQPAIELGSTPQMSTPGMPQSSATPAASDPYEQAMAYSNFLSSKGETAQALAIAEDAIKLRPKVKEWAKVRDGDKIKYAPLYEDGRSGAPVDREVAEKLEFRDSGQSIEGLDSYTGAVKSRLGKRQSLDSIASNGTQLTIAGMVDKRSRDANAIANGNRISSTSTGLRKEFDDLPEVKSYKGALPAYNAIIDASKRSTPMSDINLVYGIAKLYDPTSVVREGEYNTVANSPNIPERIKGMAQHLAGGGKLTDEIKRQIVTEAQGRIGSYETEYTKARGNYEQIAARSGADPSLLFPSAHKAAVARTTPKVAAPQGAINHLRMNPKLRDAFDAKYGVGAAASILVK